MTVTLHLTPEAETGLSAQAQAQGKSLEDYLHSLVNEAGAKAYRSSASFEPVPRVEAVRRMLEFGEKYRLQFDEPVTRALLHESHRF